MNTVKINLRILLLSFLSIVVFTTGNAQIKLDKIARDAKRSVNKRIDRNIDRALDNTLDNAEDVVRGKNKRKNRNQEEYYDEESGTIIIKEVPANAFRGEFLINRDIEGGEDEGNMYKISMDEYETAIRPLMVKKPHNLIIYNKQEDTQTTINKEKYKGKALRDFLPYNENGKKKKKYAKTERTDEVETFDGYIARKYEVKTRDYKGILWMTKEIDADISVIYQILELNDLTLDPTLGFPLKMELDYDDGQKVMYSVTDIKEEADQSIFDISEYKLVDMTDLESGN